MNTETKVGTFVIACFILLGVTVYCVGNEQWGQHLTPYKTYLRYAGGGAPGTEGLFGGCGVGRVNTARTWKPDPARLQIMIEWKEKKPLNVKTVARAAQGR